jgi:hypothetical protein
MIMMMLLLFVLFVVVVSDRMMLLFSTFTHKDFDEPEGSDVLHRGVVSVGMVTHFVLLKRK